MKAKEKLRRFSINTVRVLMMLVLIPTILVNGFGGLIAAFAPAALVIEQVAKYLKEGVWHPNYLGALLLEQGIIKEISLSSARSWVGLIKIINLIPVPFFVWVPYFILMSIGFAFIEDPSRRFAAWYENTFPDPSPYKGETRDAAEGGTSAMVCFALTLMLANFGTYFFICWLGSFY